MTYIPVVPSVPPPPPSPRTRELASVLTKVLDEFKKAQPSTTSAEIRAALRLAQMSASPGNPALPAILSVGLGLLFAVLALGFFFFRSAEGVEIGPIMPMIVLGLIVFVGILAVAIKTMSR